MKHKKKAAALCGAMCLLFAGTAIGLLARDRRLRQEPLRCRTKLEREAKTLLAEHPELFARVAEVLTRQKEPLHIDWEQELCEEEGTFHVHMGPESVSPEALEEGFSEVVAELYELVSSNIYYRTPDSPLIYIPYAREPLGLGGAQFFVVTLAYDGTEWSVQTKDFEGV